MSPSLTLMDIFYLIQKARPQNSSSSHVCLLVPRVYFIHLNLFSISSFLSERGFLLSILSVFPVNSDFSSGTFSLVTLHFPLLLLLFPLLSLFSLCFFLLIILSLILFFFLFFLLDIALKLIHIIMYIWRAKSLQS